MRGWLLNLFRHQSVLMLICVLLSRLGFSINQRKPGDCIRLCQRGDSSRALYLAALDIKHVFRLAWERTKETEKVKDGDPAVEYIEGTVIRLIAELDF